MRLLKENLHRWLRLLALGSILAVPALLMIWAARQGLFTPLSLIEARQNLREFVEANEIIGFLLLQFSGTRFL